MKKRIKIFRPKVKKTAFVQTIIPQIMMLAIKVAKAHFFSKVPVKKVKLAVLA